MVAKTTTITTTVVRSLLLATWPFLRASRNRLGVASSVFSCEDLSPIASTYYIGDLPLIVTNFVVFLYKITDIDRQQ